MADIASLDLGAPPFEAARLKLPVTLMAGTETAWYHRRAVEDLAANIPGAEAITVEGAAHGGHLTHPGDLATAVRSFLDRVT